MEVGKSVRGGVLYFLWPFQYSTCFRRVSCTGPFLLGAQPFFNGLLDDCMGYLHYDFIYWNSQVCHSCPQGSRFFTCSKFLSDCSLLLFVERSGEDSGRCWRHSDWACSSLHGKRIFARLVVQKKNIAFGDKGRYNSFHKPNSRQWPIGTSHYAGVLDVMYTGGT